MTNKRLQVFTNSYLKRVDLHVLVCIVGAVFLFQPMLAGGLPDSADGILHLYRTMLWQWAWDEGVFWPRWHTQLYQGYGYALMNFAPPLPYLLSLAFATLTQSVMAGYKAMIFVACMSYLLGMYVWSRDVLGRTAALVAAFAYGFATFRFWELYYQGNYPQFLAWGLYPWTLFFFRRLAATPSPGTFAGAVLSFTALLWTHIISLIVFAPFLGLYVVWQTIAHRKQRGWHLPLLALVVAGGVAAIFLLPAVVETQYTQVEVLTEGFFDVSEHFTSLEELLAATPRLDYRAFNPVVPSNFGRLHLALAAVGAVAIARRSLPASTRLHLLAAAAIVLLLSWMMLPASLPVWRAVPIIEFAESPTRLFGPAFLFSSLLAGASVLWLRPYRRLRAIGAAALVVALVLAVAPYQFPRNFIPVDLSARGLLRFETEQVLGMTSAGEFLGLWATDPPKQPALGEDGSRAALVGAPPGITVEVAEAGAHRLVLRTDAANAADVTVAQFFFPGWRAWVDGTETPVAPEEGTGLMRLRLPAGQHEVVLRFTATPLRWAATAISIASLAVLAGVASRLRARGAEPMRISVGRWSYAPLVLATLLVLMLIFKVAWVGPRTAWFTLESPVGEVLPAQHTTRLDVSPGVELLGYDLARSTVEQGERLFVRLFWRATEPQSEDYAVFVHLVTGPDRLILGQSDKLHPALVPMTRWTTEQYIVDEHEIEVPGTVPPLDVRPLVGLYNLRSGAVIGTTELPETITIADPSPDEGPLPATLTTPSGAAIDLLGYKMAPGEDELEVTFFWQSDGTPTEDYQLFLHVLDAGGETITQADAAPVQGRYPTTLWQSGQLIGDIHRIPLPRGANPAALRVGLYNLTTLQRLAATDSKGTALPDNAIVLPVPPAARE